MRVYLGLKTSDGKVRYSDSIVVESTATATSIITNVRKLQAEGLPLAVKVVADVDDANTTQ